MHERTVGISGIVSGKIVEGSGIIDQKLVT